MCESKACFVDISMMLDTLKSVPVPFLAEQMDILNIFMMADSC